ncbi:hypothetical protein TSUD_288640 [Trifolium subterraneum]|uniref:Uncharacterized protein n=1 Tax=Trifolium subterraneum TaxID=3900 RepID=A0A2Z6PR70_TRISU|nr:hypothetical protein TSUD_288640 [Trifolium subterraneum]
MLWEVHSFTFFLFTCLCFCGSVFSGSCVGSWVTWSWRFRRSFLRRSSGVVLLVQWLYFRRLVSFLRRVAMVVFLFAMVAASLRGVFSVVVVQFPAP